MFVGKMGEDETTREQAELTVTNQVFAVTAIVDKHAVGIARLAGRRGNFSVCC